MHRRHGPDRARALRRAPRHVGHVLRRRVHARHAVPARVGGGPAARGRRDPRRDPRAPVLAGGPRGRRRFGFEIVSAMEVLDEGRRRSRSGSAPASGTRAGLRLDRHRRARSRFAPGTGTPEAGGLTNRELLGILRGLAGVHLVGADIVEVAPPYDHAEVTAVAVARRLRAARAAPRDARRLAVLLQDRRVGAEEPHQVPEDREQRERRGGDHDEHDGHGRDRRARTRTGGRSRSSRAASRP